MKLYEGFWCIFVLSLIPLCLGSLGYSFKSVWGGINLFLQDFLGIRYWFNQFGYNPTWWFLSLIIPLYVCFPIIYYVVQKMALEVLLLSFFVFLVGGPIGILPLFVFLKLFLFPFVLGIFCAKKDIFEQISSCSYPYKKICLLICLGGFCCWRLVECEGKEAGEVLIFDGITAICFIIYSFLFIAPQSKLYNFLLLLGKHSMNIFLMHTFIFGIYLSKFSYALKYPPLILLQLLLVCLGFSIVLEKCKQFLFVGIEKCQKKCFK